MSCIKIRFFECDWAKNGANQFGLSVWKRCVFETQMSSSVVGFNLAKCFVFCMLHYIDKWEFDWEKIILYVVIEWKNILVF